jgi:hypothetical protein
MKVPRKSGSTGNEWNTSVVCTNDGKKLSENINTIKKKKLC